MKIVKCNKIIDMKKSNRGNRNLRTQAQIYSAIKIMLLNNPMRRKECREKLSKSRKGKKPSHPFPKRNQYWQLRKDIKYASSCKTDTLNSNP